MPDDRTSGTRRRPRFVEARVDRPGSTALPFKRLGDPGRALGTHGGQGLSGTFNVVHIDDAGGRFAHAVGDITCVAVGDGIAVTTGIIRHAWLRDFPGSLVVNTAVAITCARV